MPSTHSRRDVLCLCGATFGLGTAGCIEDSSERATVAASVVSDEEARDRALTAEEAFLTEQFRNASCLRNWGVSPESASTQTNVTKRTAEAVHVEVTLSYHYSTEDVEADGASNSVYAVTADSIERIQGDSISPC